MIFQCKVQHKKPFLYFLVMLFLIHTPCAQTNSWRNWIPTTLDKKTITYGAVGLALVYLGFQLLSGFNGSKVQQHRQRRGRPSQFRSRDYQQQSDGNNSSMMTQLSVGALLTVFGVVVSNSLQDSGSLFAVGDEFDCKVNTLVEDLVENSKEFYELAAEVERRDSFLQPMIIMHGPPGTGKSLRAKVLAKLHGGKSLRVNGSDIASPLVGESTKAMGRLFKKIFKIVEETDQGVVVIIDEIETFMPARKNLGGSDVAIDKRSQVNEIATGIDRILDSELNGRVLIIGTTNDKQLVDGMFNGRRKRCRMIEIGEPKKEERKKITDHYFNKYCNKKGIGLPQNSKVLQMVEASEDGTADHLEDNVIECVKLAALRGGKSVNNRVMDEVIEKIKKEVKEKKAKESNDKKTQNSADKSGDSLPTAEEASNAWAWGMLLGGVALKVSPYFF